MRPSRRVDFAGEGLGAKGPFFFVKRRRFEAFELIVLSSRYVPQDGQLLLEVELEVRQRFNELIQVQRSPLSFMSWRVLQSVPKVHAFWSGPVNTALITHVRSIIYY